MTAFENFVQAMLETGRDVIDCTYIRGARAYMAEILAEKIRAALQGTASVDIVIACDGHRNGMLLLQAVMKKLFSLEPAAQARLFKQTCNVAAFCCDCPAPQQGQFCVSVGYVAKTQAELLRGLSCDVLYNVRELHSNSISL
jgi:hypothetical protein